MSELMGLVLEFVQPFHFVASPVFNPSITASPTGNPLSDHSYKSLRQAMINLILFLNLSHGIRPCYQKAHCHPVGRWI